MTYLKTNKTRSKSKTTNGLYIGTPEAEGENLPGQGLSEYYEDYLNINEAIIEGKFIITGRKGVGKTAFVKHLCDNSSLENELLCDVVKPNHILLEKIIQSISDSVSNKYSVIYEWIILTQLVRLLLKNSGMAYADGYQALCKFVEKNSGIIDVSKWMTVTETESRNVGVDFYDLMKHFTTFFCKRFDRSKTKAPFYQLIPALREIVTKMLAYDVNKDINYIVLFDDLDISFNLNSEEQKRELMELIRIAKEYNTRYFPNPNIKVVLMLRDDIAIRLAGIAPDTNKIFSSYEYRLLWYDSEISTRDEDSKLRCFINKRIGIGLKKRGLSSFDESDPWSYLVEDYPTDEYNGKTAFKFVLDCTFYRPRDLVALFRDLGHCNFSIPINPANIKKLISRYVRWNVGEIKDELSNLYSRVEIDRLFVVLRQIANSNSGFTFDDILSELKKQGFDENAFDDLLSYNLIVPRDSKDRQYYTYREKPKIEKHSDYRYNLPKCLYLYYRPEALN